jgi:hypothetical protein
MCSGPQASAVCRDCRPYPGFGISCDGLTNIWAVRIKSNTYHFCSIPQHVWQLNGWPRRWPHLGDGHLMHKLESEARRLHCVVMAGFK